MKWIWNEVGRKYQDMQQKVMMRSGLHSTQDRLILGDEIYRGIVLASRASGLYLDTQTLLN